MKNQPTLKVTTQSNGKLSVSGLRIWSTGIFRGYGSPPEGDEFTTGELQAMADTHAEIGHKLKPRAYPGHPLNPMLKMMARPKGQITRLHRDGDNLVADLKDVDPKFWDKAMEDDARFSPDVKFGHLDPETGKRYPIAVVGLGVLGAVQPANSRLPSLQEYQVNYYAQAARAYGEGDIRSYLYDPQGDQRPLDVSNEVNMKDKELDLQGLQTTVAEAVKATDAEMEAIRQKVTSQDERFAAYATQLEDFNKLISAQQAEIETLRSEKANLQAIVEQQLVNETTGEIHSFVDGLVTDLRLAPASREAAINLLYAVAGVEGEARSYALGDLGDSGAQTLFGLTKGLLQSFPKAEVAKPIEKDATKTVTAPISGNRSFSDPDTSASLRQQTEALMTEKGISYQDAFRQVVKANLGK